MNNVIFRNAFKVQKYEKKTDDTKKSALGVPLL